MNTVREIIKKYMSKSLESVMCRTNDYILSQISEIRLRVNRPLVMVCCDQDFFITKSGTITQNQTQALVATRTDVWDTLNRICDNSIYAYLNTIRSGFITVKGGHRIGIMGKVIIENGAIKNIKDISSINIRVAREMKGIGQKVISYIVRDRKDIYNTLIISPPSYGKTTMLRDILRIISDGGSSLHIRGMKVSIIDERSEIAAVYNGVPQNDIGLRSDVLDACPKYDGMMLALRTMSPDVIATDEIGSEQDFKALLKIINCGVRVISTMHGFDILDAQKRGLSHKIFERFIILGKDKKVGEVKEILDENYNNIMRIEDEKNVV